MKNSYLPNISNHESVNHETSVYLEKECENKKVNLPCKFKLKNNNNNKKLTDFTIFDLNYLKRKTEKMNFSIEKCLLMLKNVMEDIYTPTRDNK